MIKSGSVLSITAKLQCGGCGQTFEDDIDEAWLPPPNFSLFDMAIDGLRFGASVQGEHILCIKCTNLVDDAYPETEPTFEQVRLVLAPGVE